MYLDILFILLLIKWLISFHDPQLLFSDCKQTHRSSYLKQLKEIKVLFLLLFTRNYLTPNLFQRVFSINHI